jgi:hypothetical protein
MVHQHGNLPQLMYKVCRQLIHGLEKHGDSGRIHPYNYLARIICGALDSMATTSAIGFSRKRWSLTVWSLTVSEVAQKPSCKYSIK